MFFYVTTAWNVVEKREENVICIPTFTKTASIYKSSYNFFILLDYTLVKELNKRNLI